MNPETLDAILANFKLDPQSPHPSSVQKALYLARRLQIRAGELQTPPEKRQQAELDRMLQTPSDKATLTQITDQAFRTNDPSRAVEHLIHILDVQGVPRFFGPVDRTLMKGFQSFGSYLPGVALPLVKGHLRKETANVILPGEKELLVSHLADRAREGVRMNVNFLGETILSETEAARRLDQYLDGLQWPETEVVSIKISTVYSQISALAREHTVKVLCDRLAGLFLAAAGAQFKRPSGETVPKFVYLDMEEYRDKELTAEAFMRTLDRPELQQVTAGIALQAYLPDSFATLKRIQAWGRQRAAKGGARITIRLVKGANMESERLEASLHGWPQAPFQTKLETDANYKRMVHALLEPENLAAMNAGLASHNLFDLAYGLVLAHERQALDRVQFEMLEGMANHQRRALFECSRNLLLYAPACKREHFINAIGYLIRRLDENTGPENFLRHAFRIKVDSPEWLRLEKGFLDAFAALPGLPETPRRTQNRLLPPARPDALAHGWTGLANEPDTDFALPQNSEWAAQIIGRWRPRFGDQAPRIPLVIAGAELTENRAMRPCLDPSRPGVVVGTYCQAGEQDIQTAVATAAADPDGWRSLAPSQRYETLGRVAQELRVARGDLLGAALANGGKVLTESDPEVSEAVDFLEFYRATARWWQELPTLRARGRGTVVVVSPWNFPLAIPCGGIAAALAAGNTVILKPASDTVLVAWELCQCFWRAGISRNTLQFVPCAGSAEGSRLVSHPLVNAVILTGGTETALAMLRHHPGLSLYAETGGKNATIVTAVSDRDQAIKHVLHSAFSHAGQKCSATSLLLLQDEVYQDPAFRRGLCEAAASLATGSAWELPTKMGPLIRPPKGDLEWALKNLEPGEEWALAPQPAADNPNLWTPGIKYGVQPGSRTHLTEFFGPVLGVMRFRDLAEAISLVNRTGYGLTSGLESLDEREWDMWKENIRAGNLYLNRVTTGAVVLRQPFGGLGKSVFGAGLKAGGPNYVAQFMDFTDAPLPAAPPQPADAALAALVETLRTRKLAEAGRIAAALASCEAAVRTEFALEHDHFKLVGQDNLRRYLPCGKVRVRVTPADNAFEIFTTVIAARLVGNQVTVSTAPATSSPALNLLKELLVADGNPVEYVTETDEELAVAIRGGKVDRVRFAAPDRVPSTLLPAANEAGGCMVSRPVSGEGRLELLWYLHEQSLSIDYHRYGNLCARAAEIRAEVL
jgi:RHH-type proline utilization regulon transcriptional repressor/proline dehydrogenase/delta 1-pyrroline-5-carboxylate dehydrogenase